MYFNTLKQTFSLLTPLEQFEIVEMNLLLNFGKFYVEFFFDDAQIESLGNFVLFIFFCTVFLSKNDYALQNKVSLIMKNIFYFFLKSVYYQNKKIFSGWAYSTFGIFILLLILNLQGIIPGGTTATAHLLPVFLGGLGSFVFFNFQGLLLHKFHIFNLFFPSGSPFNLALLIIPIEFVSYMFRVISISVRLFANMMAGHTLLKVIAGFAFEMFNFAGLEVYLVGGILLVLVLLSFLEFSVALIQTYVYITLCGMYYIDSLYLH
jgi:ATP synthase subunit 6